MKQITTYINEKLQLTTKPQYTCQPENKYDLIKIIRKRVEEEEGPNCDLNDIDTSKITDMSFMFNWCENFNGDISMWDVSNVKNMHTMFYKCKKFNCDISKWNVSNVEKITGMFYGCEKFRCDLSKWDVSNVKNMDYAFYDCPTYPKWYDKDKCEQ